MLYWLIILLSLISVITASFAVWILLKIRIDLRFLREIVRNHSSTLSRIDSVSSRTYVEVVLRGAGQRIRSLSEDPEVACLPSDQWSVTTL